MIVFLFRHKYVDADANKSQFRSQLKRTLSQKSINVSEIPKLFTLKRGIGDGSHNKYLACFLISEKDQDATSVVSAAEVKRYLGFSWN